MGWWPEPLRLLEHDGFAGAGAEGGGGEMSGSGRGELRAE